jgi:hypothetical protein
MYSIYMGHTCACHKRVSLGTLPAHGGKRSTSHLLTLSLFILYLTRSPPTSKRIKTSVSTSVPPQLLTQQQINPFQRVPAYEGIPIPPAQVAPQNSRKRRASPQSSAAAAMAAPVTSASADATQTPQSAPEAAPKKKGRTNTPWTAEEEQRLKTMRDAGRSWSEIAKVRLDGVPYIDRTCFADCLLLCEPCRPFPPELRGV